MGQSPYIYSPPLQYDGSDSKACAAQRIEAALRGEPQFFEWLHCRYDGTSFDAEVSLNRIEVRGEKILLAIVRDITARKRAEKEREELILELREALSKVRTLSGLLPICASCKKIRNDGGYWEQLEVYIRDHSDADFSHGMCPECAEKALNDLQKMK